MILHIFNKVYIIILVSYYVIFQQTYTVSSTPFYFAYIYYKNAYLKVRDI